MTGPSLPAKLHEILIQFRQGTYAVTADVSKAFHRIIVDEEDRKFLKFLWINLNSQELLTFQFKVVLFGATCSPYLLQETLYTHLSQNAEGNSFLDKFYVDNYMNTYDNQAELVSDKIHLDNVMNQASMPLQEWVSNNEYFNFLYQLAVPITQNVLGISWNPYTDNMNIVVGEKLILEDSWRFTKCKILSSIKCIRPFRLGQPTNSMWENLSTNTVERKKWVGIKLSTLNRSRSFVTFLLISKE